MTQLDDVIVALSSAPGPGARAIVRLSGPESLAIACQVFTPLLQPGNRQLVSGESRLDGIVSPLPADLYYWPAPRTYTGQELVELHTLSSPPIVDQLIAQLLNVGARAAQPGEFTMRAFLAGKLDLPRAEAVRGVIEAGTRAELKTALAQLAGGVTRPLDGLREDLLNLLADLEAGLDFSDEDIHFVSREQLLIQLSKGLAQLTLLRRQLNERSVSGRPFHVVLAGKPNAGKSSLFNALTGAAALVSPQPGTTRDYLAQTLVLDGIPIELIDTAGLQQSTDQIDAQSQLLGRHQAQQADLVLYCVEPGEMDDATVPGSEVVYLATKCDLDQPRGDRLATSVQTGAGLEELRQLLAERARAHSQPALAPSLSRCRHHVTACLEHLRRAHELVLFEEPPELLALELRGTLDQLGEMVGVVYTDDLLDRIFSRFCIGK